MSFRNLSVAVAAVLLAGTCVMAQAPTRAWREEVMKHRREKDDFFRADKTAPIKGLQRITLEAPKEAGLRATCKGLEVVDSGAEATARPRDGKWYWCTASGETEVKEMGQVNLGRYLVITRVISPTTLALMVFDPEHPELKAFKGMRYFAPNPKYAVPARMERVAGDDSVTLATVRNLKLTYKSYGRIHFKLGGKPQTLMAYGEEGGKELFVPFTDPTNGKSTYQVGRFLDVPMPKGETFTLDFNTAYNPLCNYANIYNCPIPPEENALKVPIPAGEKTYFHCAKK